MIELSNEDLCHAIGSLETGGKVRKLALLLFGREDSLRQLMPTHEVGWQVLDAQNVLENEFSRRPLLRTFEDLGERFRARNRSTELVDLFRTEIPDFDPDAFREALANAMTHRDYTQLGAIHVQWNEDGIRIDSPGDSPKACGSTTCSSRHRALAIRCSPMRSSAPASSSARDAASI